jgi:hypothetical protein
MKTHEETLYGLTMTPKALRRLQDLRREVLHERPERRGEEEIAETVSVTQHHTGACVRSHLHRS